MTIYKLIIQRALSGDCIRYVQVPSKWDLYGVIGYLYSNSIEAIRRIDYKTVDQKNLEKDWEETKKMFDFPTSMTLESVTLRLSHIKK